MGWRSRFMERDDLRDEILQAVARRTLFSVDEVEYALYRLKSYDDILLAVKHACEQAMTPAAIADAMEAVQRGKLAEE